ncbi:hypothetical protein Tco_1059254, partial [Tanacetum coccineum]
EGSLIGLSVVLGTNTGSIGDQVTFDFRTIIFTIQNAGINFSDVKGYYTYVSPMGHFTVYKMKQRGDVLSVRIELFQGTIRAHEYVVLALRLQASHDPTCCLPTELKELPSKITELSIDVKEIKKHVRDMDIERPGDLKEITNSIKAKDFGCTSKSIKQGHCHLEQVCKPHKSIIQQAKDKGVPSASKSDASPANDIK